MTETNEIVAVIVAELRKQSVSDALMAPYIAVEFDGNWTIDGVVDVNAIAAAIMTAGYRRESE